MHRPLVHSPSGRLLALATIALSLAIVPLRADAQPTRGPVYAGQTVQHVPSEVSGEVLVILASEREGEVDPALQSMQALRQPPFNGFHSMQLLARPTIHLTVGQPQNVPLPNGRVLQLALESITPEGRYRVRVSINRPEQQDYLPLLEIVAPPGDPFFLAGQNFMGGTLVIGIRLGERPAR
ncbi:MAG: hypothetical protein K1X94_19275 [Sandaracinaceae bacterium]|jgi:hypothetical protein|nr:hypothetical protein [Sandaracinaceae bacterium]